jgi:hypothetical protein
VNTAAYILNVFNETATAINKLPSFDDVALAKFENRRGEEEKSSYFFKTVTVKETGTPK